MKVDKFEEGDQLDNTDRMIGDEGGDMLEPDEMTSIYQLAGINPEDLAYDI